MSQQLDREIVLRAFKMMARELRRNGRRGEIMIAGGAVMALQYEVDRVTRDVDGLISEGHGAVIAASHKVAGELDLPRGWLNEGVSVYLSMVPDVNRATAFDHPNLIVYAASAKHMLSLKARAARAQDIADLRALISHLEIQTSAEVIDIVAEFFPDDPLNAKSIAAIQDIFLS